MRKSTLILPLLLLCFVTAWSQKIKYQSSFEAARKLSLEQNKPLSILITAQPPAYVTNNLGILAHPDVVTRFNTNFINYTIAREDTASRAIISVYKITRFPSFVFLDSKGGVLFKDLIVFPNPQKILEMADQVMEASNEKSLVDFDREYAAGGYDRAFLKAYIIKRSKAGIKNNAGLIEKYIDFLTIADLDDYRQVLFILQAGPLADSRAFKLAYTNPKIADSIFRTEPFEVRTALNNGIIANSMASAISSKSISKANAVANFTRTTWGRDYRNGQKNYALKMLQYYSAVKDSGSYLREATRFYDEYYMNVTADSLKRRDEKNMEMAKNRAHERATLDIPEGGALQSFSYTYASNNFATELNNAAYSVYLTGTTNTTHINKAMLWSKRSIELNPVAAYYDTYAHLLYRMGFYAEATINQQKAVDLTKAQKREVKQLQEELVKIKNKTL